MICAVVPIKSFASAKTRLGAKLDARRRAALAQASAVLVLKAMAACAPLDRRIAVVEDDEAATLARTHLFEVLVRPELLSQSAAVEAGFALALRGGATTLLTLSADVPLARPEDIAGLLKPKAPALVMVSNLQGEGTNALCLSPAQYLRLHFGPGSLEQHRREARLLNLPVTIVDNPRLRMDIDTPDDLDALEKSGPEGRRVLVEAGKLVRAEELEEEWAARSAPG
ncbi:MAG: 2-phospho-L-lactate guanylyltransferase [Candidatus Dormibacteria bacterium]